MHFVCIERMAESTWNHSTVIILLVECLRNPTLQFEECQLGTGSRHTEHLHKQLLCTFPNIRAEGDLISFLSVRLGVCFIGISFLHTAGGLSQNLLSYSYQTRMHGTYYGHSAINSARVRCNYVKYTYVG